MRPGQLLSSVDEPPPPPGHSGPSGYEGPPPTAAHDPGTAPQPWLQYGYPPPYPPPYEYAYGYPQPAPAGRRPAAVTAAAVLGYISGGLLVIAAMIVFTGASLLAGIDDSSDVVNLRAFTVELTFDGMLNLVCSGLLIGGGVLMSARRPGGRTMYSIAAAVVAADAVYWLARWGTSYTTGQGIVGYALMFCAVSVSGLVLVWRSASSAWFAG
jgi:hypothetical protein